MLKLFLPYKTYLKHKTKQSLIKKGYHGARDMAQWVRVSALKAYVQIPSIHGYSQLWLHTPVTPAP